jgi:hypothetical protein
VFQPDFAPGGFDENLTHRFRRHPEEVHAVLSHPVTVAISRQAQPCLVDQGLGL